MHLMLLLRSHHRTQRHLRLLLRGRSIRAPYWSRGFHGAFIVAGTKTTYGEALPSGHHDDGGHLANDNDIDPHRVPRLQEGMSNVKISPFLS